MFAPVSRSVNERKCPPHFLTWIHDVRDWVLSINVMKNARSIPKVSCQFSFRRFVIVVLNCCTHGLHSGKIEIYMSKKLRIAQRCIHLSCRNGCTGNGKQKEKQ